MEGGRSGTMFLSKEMWDEVGGMFRSNVARGPESPGPTIGPSPGAEAWEPRSLVWSVKDEAWWSPKPGILAKEFMRAGIYSDAVLLKEIENYKPGTIGIVSFEHAWGRWAGEGFGANSVGGVIGIEQLPPDLVLAGPEKVYRMLPLGSCPPMIDEHVIWSGEHRAWWRAGRSGYCAELLGAGIYAEEGAGKLTAHCGPEKKIRIVPLKQAWEEWAGGGFQEGSVGDAAGLGTIPAVQPKKTDIK